MTPESDRSRARAAGCTGRRGIAAVEMAILSPLLILFLFGIIEVGAVFFVRHNMFHAAREAARGLAVGSLSASDAEALALDRLADINATFDVSASDAGAGDDVSVEITTTLDDAALGDVLGLFSSASTLHARVAMRKEDS
ncbi:MAG: TadE family protein [Planctomycetota bacterium]